MKKRTLILSLALVAVLTALMPATALAARPASFEASGEISYITPGDVFPAGESGRWVVAQRELGGTLTGDLDGEFTLIYKANVESVETQAGNLHGKMTVVGDAPCVLNINGRIEPLEFVQMIPNPDPDPAPGDPEEVPLFELTIGGHWTCLSGGHGNGDFSADVIFIPTREGHVGYIALSLFTMTGQWK